MRGSLFSHCHETCNYLIFLSFDCRVSEIHAHKIELMIKHTQIANGVKRRKKMVERMEDFLLTEFQTQRVDNLQ